ncbi:cytochrome c oxidase subunit ii [Leptolyngbya sp. Heron Island J]|uniref:cytochrome c oxidase subunit II n=1 Tax=Leptolyngbya sp. Heron Island J TaxID=1385935 RepID=UPI0003B9E2B9|nr:cytochrome c oxidase subunit II [Leptolyngbya sp. Heron Island J]ESA36388.1 cytochrome c oxidase subunit ii [Leptolyngbya sp. Heron Island J]
MNGIPTSIITMLIGIAVTLISLWYGQNHGLMPVAASAEASEVDQLFNLMMTIGTGLFLIVEGSLIIALIRFRRKEGDEADGPHIEGNIPLEIVWTAIPAIIVLGLSVYSFEIYTEMGGLNLMEHHSSKAVQLAYSPSSQQGSMLAAAGLGEPPDMGGESMGDVLNIDVLGLQFAFVMTYPETGIVDGEVHVPVDTLVKLNLKAQDVIHAFWLPEFRIKQDMIPGQETSLVVRATREGTYPIVCAELCGSYHGGMRTQMIVHSAADYDEWQQKRIAEGATDLSTAIATASHPPDETDAEYLAHFESPIHTPAEHLDQLPHAHMDMALMP